MSYETTTINTAKMTTMKSGTICMSVNATGVSVNATSTSADTASATVNTTGTSVKMLLDLPVIKLSRNARRQFRVIYANIGNRLLCSVRLRLELGEYIRYREAGDAPLDTMGQTLRFDENIAVCIMKVHGQWIITDVWELAPVIAFVPVRMWKRFKKGVNEIVKQVLIGWRYPTSMAAVNGIGVD